MRGKYYSGDYLYYFGIGQRTCSLNLYFYIFLLLLLDVIIIKTQNMLLKITYFTSKCIKTKTWYVAKLLIRQKQRLYSNHLNTRQVRYLNGPNASGFGMVVWKPDKKMSGLWSKMSGIQMIWTITWSAHLKTRQKSVQKFKCSNIGCPLFRWLQD